MHRESIKAMHRKRKRRYKSPKRRPLYIVLRNATISNSIIGTGNAHNTINGACAGTPYEQIISDIFKQLSDGEKINVIVYASKLTHGS